jgi:hypothetical protein
MASANFRNLPRAFAKGDIDFDTLTCKVLLVSSVPSESNLDTWVNRSDVTNEVTGSGYTAGGVAQAFTLGSLDTTNNRQPITYSDNATAWTSATISAVGAIIYKNSGSSATDTLMHFIDFGGTVSVSPGTFGLSYSAPFYISA